MAQMCEQGKTVDSLYLQSSYLTVANIEDNCNIFQIENQ